MSKEMSVYDLDVRAHYSDYFVGTLLEKIGE